MMKSAIIDHPVLVVVLTLLAHGCESNVGDDVVCVVDDGVASDQVELDELQGCTKVSGDINVFSATEGEINIQPMSSIRTVTGNLYLAGPSVDLSVLQVEEVGGQFSVGSNLTTDLDGLQQLKSVGQQLNLAFNSRLVSLSGLSSLEKAGGEISIECNDVLPRSEVDALSARLDRDITYEAVDTCFD